MGKCGRVVMAVRVLEENLLIRPMLRYATLWLLGALALALVACGSDPAPVIAPDRTAPPKPVTTSTAELPTVTPEATSTTVATSPPSATTIPTVEGEKVPRNPEVERLGAVTMETLTFLTNELSPRASGTQEEVAAAEYLRDEFAALGTTRRFSPSRCGRYRRTDGS